MTTHPDASPATQEATVGQLVDQATKELSLLMRQEIALAKTELKQEGMKAGKAYGMMGGAGFAGYMVLLFGSAAAWGALTTVLSVGVSALIVAVIWAIIGAILYTLGRRNMRQVHPLPARTAETLKELPETLKRH
jgi:hypothetical protein